MSEAEDRTWQRLDKWLWCARFLKARADCARLVRGGLVRINRQPTDKPHARLRPGDVLTLPLRSDVVVVRVLALAARRGPASDARGLYEALDGLRVEGNDCISAPPPTDEIAVASPAEAETRSTR